MQQDLYAYSLSNLDAGWAWRVYDHDGGIVASGLEPSQTDAVAAVRRLIPVQPALADLG